MQEAPPGEAKRGAWRTGPTMGLLPGSLQDVIVHPGYKAGDKATTEMSSDFALLV